MKYTLDTDFSALNGPKAANWLRNFTDMTEGAFAGRDNQTRMLGNLLVTDISAIRLSLSFSMCLMYFGIAWEGKSCLPIRRVLLMICTPAY